MLHLKILITLDQVKVFLGIDAGDEITFKAQSYIWNAYRRLHKKNLKGSTEGY